MSALEGGAAAEFLADVITPARGHPDDVAGDDTDKPKRHLERVNELLVMLRAGDVSAASSAPAETVDLVASPLRVWPFVGGSRCRNFSSTHGASP